MRRPQAKGKRGEQEEEARRRALERLGAGVTPRIPPSGPGTWRESPPPCPASRSWSSDARSQPSGENVNTWVPKRLWAEAGPFGATCGPDGSLRSQTLLCACPRTRPGPREGRPAPVSEARRRRHAGSLPGSTPCRSRSQTQSQRLALTRAEDGTQRASGQTGAASDPPMAAAGHLTATRGVLAPAQGEHSTVPRKGSSAGHTTPRGSCRGET